MKYIQPLTVPHTSWQINASDPFLESGFWLGEVWSMSVLNACWFDRYHRRKRGGTVSAHTACFALLSGIS